MLNLMLAFSLVFAEMLVLVFCLVLASGRLGGWLASRVDHARDEAASVEQQWLDVGKRMVRLHEFARTLAGQLRDPDEIAACESLIEALRSGAGDLVDNRTLGAESHGRLLGATERLILALEARAADDGLAPTPVEPQSPKPADEAEPEPAHASVQESQSAMFELEPAAAE